MKKLTKLNINPEKVIKNEELMTLRGGYDDPDCSSTDKITACSFPGAYRGHGCCWTWNGNVYYGHCNSFYGGSLYCSDLN